MTILRHQLIKGILAISSCCLYLNSPVYATPSKLESSSPFLPPGYSSLKRALPKPAQRPNSPLAKELEFRGIVQLNGTYQFSLFKKSENRGYWIPEDGYENGIEVSNFDVDSMQITVTANGRSEQLSLVAASEDPLPVVATSAAKAPILPPGVQLRNSANKNPPTRRTIPRRRVILPTKQ